MNLQQLVGTVNGATIVSLDTETVLPLNKTIMVNGERHPNPHYGRVTKRTTGLNVMLFSNKNSNGATEPAPLPHQRQGSFNDPQDFLFPGNTMLLGRFLQFSKFF